MSRAAPSGFVAEQVAKTGEMRITTPTAIVGVRGTTGVVEVAAGGVTNVKLYEDENGSVGRIEIFNRQGQRLAELTQAATGYAIQIVAQQVVANALNISPQQLVRDRNIVRNVFNFKSLGRNIINQRLNLRDLPRNHSGCAATAVDPGPAVDPGLPAVAGIPDMPTRRTSAVEFAPLVGLLYPDIVDQPGLAEPCSDQQADRPVRETRNRLKRLGMARFEIIDVETRVASIAARPSASTVASVLAGLDPGGAVLQHAIKRRRGLPFARARGRHCARTGRGRPFPAPSRSRRP